MLLPCRWVQELQTEEGPILRFRELTMQTQAIEGSEKAGVIQEFFTSQLDEWDLRHSLPLPVTTD